VEPDAPGGLVQAPLVPVSDLAVVLRAYNQRCNHHDAVMAGIEAIASGAPVVVGGQQAGLWTGPLLVIHKAVTTIQAARHASEVTGSPVVPIFWIAGEDHDFAEVNHTYVLEEETVLRKIHVKRPFGANRAVSQTPLSKDAKAAVLTELAKALPDTVHKQALLEQLRACGMQASTLSEWFAHIIGDLFGKHGLVLVDADDPGVRQLEAAAFREIILRGDELRAAYGASAAVLTAQGLPVQADVYADCANLFYYMEDGERTLLFWRDGQYVNRRGSVALSQEELLRIAAQSPERLSNNVLTRPLMQSCLLPVLGAVLGHGEMAYWALTGQAFAALGMPMPLIVPRAMFTLVTHEVQHTLDAQGWTFADVRTRFPALRADWLRARDALGIPARFLAVREQIASLHDEVAALGISLRPDMRDLAAKNRARILRELDYLELRTEDAHAAQYDAYLRRLDAVSTSLWPLDKPQERVLNFTVYWNQYGLDWIDDLLALPFDPQGGHYIAQIG
jgi:bacillithiol biosynthesis cysteine-adding enzyme BshC